MRRFSPAGIAGSIASGRSVHSQQRSTRERKPPAAITSLTVDGRPVFTSSGKAVLCSGDSFVNSCLAIGANANPIGKGI